MDIFRKRITKVIIYFNEKTNKKVEIDLKLYSINDLLLVENFILNKKTISKIKKIFNLEDIKQDSFISFEVSYFGKDLLFLELDSLEEFLKDKTKELLSQ